MIFFLNVIFCPKTAIVSKMCKDQDLGRVQKYSVPIKKGKKIFFGQNMLVCFVQVPNDL